MIVMLSFAALVQAPPPPPKAPLLSEEQIEQAACTLGLDFTAPEVLQMQAMVIENMQSYARLQRIALDNAVAPAFTFSPLLPGVTPAAAKLALEPLELPRAARPADLEELAFADIVTLQSLIRSRQVSCVELTEMYLARSKRLDDRLRCVINYTEERALKQARALDAELAEGRWRGMLHGIPWGAKDLLAVRGTPTTWGSALFEHQVLDLDAAVVERLDAAGAVLIAKLALGELAYGDLWFGGRTRNPWDIEQGSSGSSAGSASATAAGCVAFAIGSETLGSIVSPSTVCGTTGLRPTFGRVSRHGAMALSWTMDKLGPICRSVDDAALVFDVLHGPDGKDGSVIAAPFQHGRAKSLAGLKVGYPKEAFEDDAKHAHVLDELRSLGVELVEIELPQAVPSGDLLLVLVCEAAAAFDQLTRDGSDERMVWQEPRAWPNTFRAARLIPAVEYIRCMRLRTQLMHAMQELMESVDAYVHPSWSSDSLLITNLTGHPAVVAPDGFDASGHPRSITFTGRLFGESDLCALARAWQQVGGYHRRHPKL